MKNKNEIKELLKNIRIKNLKFKINKFSLIKSELSKDGPTYSIIEDFVQ